MWMYSEPCISTQHIDTIERKCFSLLIGTNMVLTMRMESTHNFMSLIFSTFDIRVVPHFFSSFSSSDAAYYANWLSIVYGLKDRSLKNLLVFLPKIEDLTLLTLVCFQTKGKREIWLYFALKSPFRKDRAWLWLFRWLWMQNHKWVHGFFSL